MKRSLLTIKKIIQLLIFVFIVDSCSMLPRLSRNLKKDDQTETGLEVLYNSNFDILKGKRIGLITNQTGLNKDLIQNIDLFLNSNEIDLKAIFSPEHGFKGTEAAGKKLEDRRDESSGLFFYSLYGKTKKPTTKMLQNIDVLVFDIQDIGIRSYTYISTMGLAMRAASENNIKFVVLDRPNPLGGLRVEGNILDIATKSFIGMYPIPYVYGLTCGELALFINNEIFQENEKCILEVVKMKHWSRDKLFNNTYLSWIPTSPHVPNQETPFYMVSTGALGELGVFSVGVGYTNPFQVIAAPWIDAKLMSEKMNDLGIRGVTFRPINFTPYYAIYKDTSIGGVQIHFSELDHVNLFLLQFSFLQEHNKLYPDKNPFKLSSQQSLNMYDKAMGSFSFKENLLSSDGYIGLKEDIDKDVAEFKKISKKYFLYE